MTIDYALKKILKSSTNTEHFMSVFTTDLLLTQKLAYDASNRTEYIGYALPNTGSGQPKWAIKKLTYNASGLVTDVQFANGEAIFDKIWDSRAGYSYS